MAADPAYLQTAIEIVLRAGRIQRDRRGTDLRVGKKGTIDLVTEVDVAVETMGRAVIADRFPAHTVLAEELPNAASTGARGAGGCWIFDPLDGTVNYAHGIPFYCTSLALELDGVLEVGVVYDPAHEELFVAERGGGARLNGRPIRVSPTTDLVDAMLCTGFPYDVHATIDEMISLFRAFVGRARAVRRLGSAALDLCYVAAGRLDGFWERRLHPWDTAAGALLIEEAGGRVSGMDEEPFDPRLRHVLASNGSLHPALLEVIRSVDGRSPNGTT